MPLAALFSSPAVRVALKALLCAGGLALLWRWLGHERAFALWTPQLLLGLGLSQLSMLAYARRFCLTMRLAGFDLSLRQSLRTLTLSVFGSFFLPLSAGAELAKFSGLRQIAPERRGLAIAAALTLDHALGFIALLLLSLGLLWWAAPLGEQLRWLAPAAALSLLCLLSGVLLAHRRRWLPARLGTILTILIARPGALLGALAWSMTMHALLAAAVYAGSRGWPLVIDYTQVLFVLTGAGLFQLLPLGVGGVGAGDVAGVGLYLALGLTRANALLLASLLYGYRLCMALIGGLWWLAPRRP